MNNCLEVHNLSKSYNGFTLSDASFVVPKGTIMGLIGENGAGKSTTIGAILGLIKKNSGTVSFFGNDAGTINKTTYEQIGVVFDGSNFPEILSPKRINYIMKKIYSTWDELLYFSYLERMNLPLDKKIKEFSKGMKMKLGILTALAHHPKLLILDEATSGLDPIVRDDILDIFLEFVQDAEHSILVSSHITSDLEKIADYITFIHQGNVVFSKPKDELLYNYGIIKCGAALFDSLDKTDILVYRKKDYEWEILVADKAKVQKKYPKAIIDNTTIDNIMLLYVKGERE